MLLTLTIRARHRSRDIGAQTLRMGDHGTEDLYHPESD
jgi:hypothetical protein